ALFLDHLSAQFKRKAARAELAVNPAFSGAYDYSRPPDYGALMREFLDGIPEGGVIMCHPGFVDDVLIGLDPLTRTREVEHAYLAGDEFPLLLAANKVTLSCQAAGPLAAYRNLIFEGRWPRHKPPLHLGRVLFGMT